MGEETITVEALIGQLVEARRALGNGPVYFRDAGLYAGVRGKIRKVKLVGRKIVLCEDATS